VPRYAVMTSGFESWCASRPMGHERMVEEFAQAGIGAIEPSHTDFEQSPELIGRYNRVLADHGMRVAAVDVICDLAYSSPQEKMRGRESYHRGLEICAELGAGIAHVAGHMPKKGVSLGDARKRIVEQLMSEHDFAAKRGLTLAVDDYGAAPTLICRAEDCLEALQMSDGRLRFVFDVGNFEFVSEHADKNLDLLYPYTCHVHFKDYRAAPGEGSGDVKSSPRLVDCPLGDGIVPAGAVAQRMRDKGYSGWLALEPCSLPEDPICTVKRDLAVLKRWIE
jgi:sugar phosphate isomerase/epimerase